jgi:NDP-sugar pyrophosphorylase family protein
VGVDRFIVNTHHRPEVYAEKFPDRHYRNCPIIFRHEPVLLDTAGGLKNIEDLLGKDETIICYNGDVIAEFPLQELSRFHDGKHAEATLVLRSRGPLLNVAMDDNGGICDIRNTFGNPGIKKFLFTGIYAVNTSILQHIDTGKVESIISIFLKRIKDKPGSIAGLVMDEGYWHDIGSPEAFEILRSSLAGMEGK